MGKRILVLDHMEFPTPDAGQLHLADRGCTLDVRRACAGDPLPDLWGVDGVLVLGGAQMVTDLDRQPWMEDEMELMQGALTLGVPMLCICLGAQMLARMLGASVGPDPQDRISWRYHPVRAYPVEDNPIPDGLVVLSGNFQGFSRPRGAEMLATADGPWPNQAFRIGSALATQFHPEVTRPILDEWQKELAPHLHRPGASDIPTQDADFAAHDPALKAWYRGLLDRWFALA